MWIIGELEDERYSHKFARLSVAAVPEIWILIIDGIIYCHWPKVNAVRKIKSAEPPIANDKNWSLYKCRLLLDGEKFSTYKDAKMAERICESVSTFSALKEENEELGDEMLDDAMEDATVNYNEIINGFTVEHITQSSSCVDYSSCDNLRVINDFVIEDLESDEMNDGFNASSNSFIVEDDRSDSIEFNDGSMLTSTRIESNDSLRYEIDDVESDDEEIEQIQYIVSSFSANIQKRLNKLKDRKLQKQRKRFVAPMEGSSANSVSGEMKMSVPTANMQEYKFQEDIVPGVDVMKVTVAKADVPVDTSPKSRFQSDDTNIIVTETDVPVNTIQEDKNQYEVRETSMLEKELAEVPIVQDGKGQDVERDDREKQRINVGEVSIPTGNNTLP